MYREVIESSAKKIYPHVNWHVTEPLDDPTKINIMATITFYAQTNLDKSNLEAVGDRAPKMIAIEIEGVYVTLQDIIQNWLEK